MGDDAGTKESNYYAWELHRIDKVKVEQIDWSFRLNSYDANGLFKASWMRSELEVNFSWSIFYSCMSRYAWIALSWNWVCLN